jgi:hypothetical protein
MIRIPAINTEVCPEVNVAYYEVFFIITGCILLF